MESLGRATRLLRLVVTAVVVPLLAALLVVVAPDLASGAPARGTTGPPPIEPFATYQPATGCDARAKPGTVLLGHWLVRRFGGGFGPISRPCTKGGSVSEHTEGRAFDWMNSATSPRDRARVSRALGVLFATDRWGDEDALARRMGLMYVIWDDHIYSAWDHFAPRPYLNSACRTRRHCSTTLRHRDHVHFSLTRAAARERTSWYLARLALASAPGA